MYIYIYIYTIYISILILVLQFMGSQGIGHDWVTELNWTEKKGFPGESPVKNLPALQESWEDPLTEGMATYPSTLA